MKDSFTTLFPYEIRANGAALLHRLRRWIQGEGILMQVQSAVGGSGRFHVLLQDSLRPSRTKCVWAFPDHYDSRQKKPFVNLAKRLQHCSSSASDARPIGMPFTPASISILTVRFSASLSNVKPSRKGRRRVFRCPKITLGVSGKRLDKCFRKRV